MTISKEKCPKCNGSNIYMMLLSIPHSWCMDCASYWESLPSGEPRHEDEPFFPFDTPCNNCAFRKDSPERQNKEQWKELLETLKRSGNHFYCHKGVPIKEDQSNDGVDFEYPKLENGKCDIENMRLCRGYLNYKVYLMMKENENV
jgi:hypothetical protein